MSHFQCSINLVQLDLQGYNPRNGQGLPKVGYKGLSNYSNSSTVGFEPQTSCMAVWQPNHYTKIARPTHLNIEDEDILYYLHERRLEIDLKNIHKVIYIKPKVDNMLR